MSCPWAKIDKLEPVKLEKIVSEEVARNVKAKQEKKCWMKLDDKISTAEVNGTSADKITRDDSESESNKEFEQLECAVKICSGSYVDNFHNLSLNDDFESDSEEEDIVDMGDEEDWDMFDPLDKEFASATQSVSKKNKKMETAECVYLKRGKNTCKLSSKVFNSRQLLAYNEEFRRYKVQRYKNKRPPSQLLGIDPRAWCLIREMIKNKVIYKVIGIRYFDKDAIILEAIHHWPQPPYNKYTIFIPATFCLIKVFKFNLKTDKSRAAACQKAEEEAAAIKRIKTVYKPGLTVIAVKEHVLVTSCPPCWRVSKLMGKKLIWPH